MSVSAIVIPALLLAAALAQPVAEQSFVRIGGIDQWITIKGANRDNPVVLFLHGGPGDAYSPYADSMFRGWDTDLTLVQWDQRGAGRTFAKNGESIEPTMTVDRMVSDGIEVAEYLTAHLHKKKIILTGGSWGSILGISMIHARPDLFAGYIGDAQIVNWLEGVQASYARVLELARSAGDQASVDALTSIGPPPWDSIRKWPVYRKVERAYQAKLVTAIPVTLQIDPAYASEQERAQFAAADDFSFIHFIGMKMDGPITRVDLRRLGRKFAVPIDIVQGEEDLNALPGIAKQYLDSIRAPRKEFHLVPGTGHEPSQASLEVIHRILLDRYGPSGAASRTSGGALRGGNAIDHKRTSGPDTK